MEISTAKINKPPHFKGRREMNQINSTIQLLERKTGGYKQFNDFSYNR